MKTIYINGRFLTQPVTGVQRYSLELIRHMDQLLTVSPRPDIKFICLAPPEERVHPGWKNIEIRNVGLNRGNLWEQFDLAICASGDLLFSPANIGPWHYRNQVVTFHDASIFAIPNAYTPLFRAKYIFAFKQLSRRARAIFTDSRFSQRELAHYLNLPPERFVVISPGSDHLNDIIPDPSILSRKGLKKNSYLLVVGTHSIHKNLEVVIRTLALLNSKIKISVVGRDQQTIFLQKRSNGPPPEVISLGYVTDGALKALYQNALALVFPSIYEGFGLPVLEAMQLGCPVICSNMASLPDVAGNAALYFDPQDANGLIDVLGAFLSNPQLAKDLGQKGYENSARFLWSAAARQIFDYLVNIQATA